MYNIVSKIIKLGGIEDIKALRCKMSKLYSTGPIENAINITTPSVSSNIIIKLSNKNLNQIAEVEVIVFRLNGTKTQIYINTI